jgi:hypothetical protein
MNEFFNTELEYLFENEIDEWFESEYKEVSYIQLSLNYGISQFKNKTLTLNYKMGKITPPLKKFTTKRFDEI